MTFEEEARLYENDPLFHTVVDMLHSFLLQGEITVGELRDAATLAGIRFEMLNVNPYIILNDELENKRIL